MEQWTGPAVQIVPGSIPGFASATSLTIERVSHLSYQRPSLTGAVSSAAETEQGSVCADPCSTWSG